MSKAVTTGKLFDSLNQQLHLTWIAGKRGADRLVRDPDQQDSTLIGRTNFIHSYRIQILGSQELHYLNGVDGHALNDLIHRLFDCKPAMVILANNEPAPHLIFEAADSTSTPLLSTSLRASPLISDLQYYLQTLVADRETVHGVFMEVMGMGILLAGDCAVGKSELALELISRGHRLIADDAPEFVQIGPTMLQGTCPDVLQDFLEVRGLGILNVRAMFGDSVIKLSKNLKLIINL
ncbi:MAG TPA: HPr(Ser) kinase/phosphatase, partial [Chromatiaceae bacterium]|nr:HPr(Ser) kinase/phosphatase [Chromatiaceae bacterium]